MTVVEKVHYQYIECYVDRIKQESPGHPGLSCFLFIQLLFPDDDPECFTFIVVFQEADQVRALRQPACFDT